MGIFELLLAIVLLFAAGALLLPAAGRDTLPLPVQPAANSDQDQGCYSIPKQPLLQKRVGLSWCPSSPQSPAAAKSSHDPEIPHTSIHLAVSMLAWSRCCSLDWMVSRDRKNTSLGAKAWWTKREFIRPGWEGAGGWQHPGGPQSLSGGTCHH